MSEVIMEPLTLSEAAKSPQRPLWKRAIQVEIEALRANGTFTLVTPPADAHVIGTTINFRIKRNSDAQSNDSKPGSVHKVSVRYT